MVPKFRPDDFGARFQIHINILEGIITKYKDWKQRLYKAIWFKILSSEKATQLSL